MNRLILIKHAAPRIEPGLPPDTWELSEEGRAKAADLAGRLRAYELGAMVTSEEPKAAQTGRIVAEALAIKAITAPDLHEHDRSNVPHMRTGEFISHVEVFFRKPDERVLGLESADEALGRFESALRRVIEEQRAHDTIGVVAHGTVIALLIAARNPQHNGFATWRQMKLPSYAVLQVPGLGVEEIVHAI